MEQRRNTRISVDSQLMLAIPGFGLAPVRASNVSAGGACVQIARHSLAVGTLVQVVYVARNDASVKHRHVRAWVIHASGGWYGLAFTSPGTATTFDMVDTMTGAGGRLPATNDGARINTVNIEQQLLTLGGVP